MSRRNHCIDTIKGIACIAVVLVHYNWGGESGNIIRAVSRFAVPFFFFVSGYYLPNSFGVISTGALRKKIFHIFRMLVTCAVFYGIFCVYWNSIIDESWNVWVFTRELITLWKLANMIISGNVLVYAHFWYLLCLLYCYLTIFAVHKRAHDRAYQIAFVVFLAVYTILAEFQQYFGLRNYLSFGPGYSLIPSNLALLRSMPFFLWGVCLKKATQKESSCLSKEHPGIVFWILLIMALASCFLAIYEARKFGDILMYCGSHLTTITLSLMAVWYPEKQVRILEYIGNKLSMYIYIFHIAVGKTWDLIATKCHLWGNGTFKALRPMIVVACSILVAQVIIMVKNRNLFPTAFKKKKEQAGI